MKEGELSASPLDILVLDFDSLIDENKEPIIARIHLLPDLYQYFDLKIWRGGLKNKLFKLSFNKLLKLYEFDFAEFLYFNEKKLKTHLKLSRSLLLTSKHELIARFGNLAINEWGSADHIAHVYDLENTQK